MNFTRAASTKGDIQIGKEASHPERERERRTEDDTLRNGGCVFIYFPFFLSFSFLFYFFGGTNTEHIYSLRCSVYSDETEEPGKRQKKGHQRH